MINRYYFREWRVAAGLSLRGLAKKIGHSYPTCQRIETGERDYFGVYLADFANGLGLNSIADPITRKPDMFLLNGGKLLSLQDQKRIAKHALELAKSVREAIPPDASDEADPEADTIPDIHKPYPR